MAVVEVSKAGGVERGAVAELSNGGDDVEMGGIKDAAPFGV